MPAKRIMHSYTISFGSLKVFVSGSILGILSSLSFLSVANSQMLECKGSLGAITVTSLKVPRGFTCILNRTNVLNNIEVESQATLIINQSKIEGHIWGQQAHKLMIDNKTIVNGSIQYPRQRRRLLR